MENYELVDNIKRRRYEFSIDGQIAYIEYMRNAIGDIYLTHTEVPAKLGGRGIGTQLVEKTLLEIEAQGIQMIPLCPFVINYIRKNPEWAKLVPPGHSI
jgi:predicted GNAT family acetyltransferase